MEEQKYYTPAPEDMRIGYECEILKWIDGILIPERWEKRIISAEGASIQIEIAINRINKYAVRVPYLTADQIEAEGWIRADQVTDKIFSKGHCHLVLHDDHKVRITNGRKDIYFGTCRCINDLKTISKLLGI